MLCCAAPPNLLAFYLFYKEVKGDEGGEGKESKHVGEVQIESEGLSFVLLLLEVQFGSPPEVEQRCFKASKIKKK